MSSRNAGWVCHAAELDRGRQAGRDIPLRSRQAYWPDNSARRWRQATIHLPLRRFGRCRWASPPLSTDVNQCVNLHHIAIVVFWRRLHLESFANCEISCKYFVR